MLMYVNDVTVNSIFLIPSLRTCLTSDAVVKYASNYHHKTYSELIVNFLVEQ